MTTNIKALAFDLVDGKLELKITDDSNTPHFLIERVGKKIVQVTVEGKKLMEELGGE